MTALVLIAYSRTSSRPPRASSPRAGRRGAGGLRALGGDYALARDVDRFSGAHARLFASRVGAALAVLCPFPAAALFWRDRRACRAAVYARGVSSMRFVLCRAAALTAAMFLPVAVMALTLTSVAATDYGLANIDVLAYGKYALFWLLPTILLCTSIGALPAALTGLPLGPLAALCGAGRRATPRPLTTPPCLRLATRRWAKRRAFWRTRARWREAASPPSCWGRRSWRSAHWR